MADTDVADDDPRPPKKEVADLDDLDAPEDVEVDNEGDEGLLADADDEDQEDGEGHERDDDQFEGDKVYPKDADDAVVKAIDMERPSAATASGDEGEGERAEVKCSTSKGEVTLMLHRDWSPRGYDKASALFERGYYDHSHFFRVVPHFLVQFGIGYTDDDKLRNFADSSIPDDPKREDLMPFKEGYISFAGSGPNSRSSQLFVAYDKAQSLGSSPWETPIGSVEEGMDVVRNLHSGYGDMPPWGKGPEQGPIRNRGSSYIEKGFPLLDSFGTCAVRRIDADGAAIETEAAKRASALGRKAGAPVVGEEPNLLRNHARGAGLTPERSRAGGSAGTAFPEDSRLLSPAARVGAVLLTSLVVFLVAAFRIVSRGRRNKEGKKV